MGEGKGAQWFHLPDRIHATILTLRLAPSFGVTDARHPYASESIRTIMPI